MEKHRKKFSIRLIEKIGHDEEEREIIQYGLHQGFLILLNLLTTVVCGIRDVCYQWNKWIEC